jgi:hypothetical protein
MNCSLIKIGDFVYFKNEIYRVVNVSYCLTKIPKKLFTLINGEDKKQEIFPLFFTLKVKNNIPIFC